MQSCAKVKVLRAQVESVSMLGEGGEFAAVYMDVLMVTSYSWLPEGLDCPCDHFT